jgi:uncharacterized protein YjbI with pentapeptide repeats
VKIIKPQTLSLLTRPFEFRREFWLGISVIAFLPIGEMPVLLPETALWPFLAEELPPEQPLDAAIPKMLPEFLAVAHAFAPGGVAAPQVATGIQLGPLIKTLDVFGDRQHDGQQVSEAVPFTRMPIDWARAYGGATVADNPLGKGAAPLDGPRRRLFPVPNILDLKLERAALRTPVGYGPVDQMWPARLQRAGTHDDAWLQQDFPGFARDIDWRFFNTAPPDQWFPQPLRGDEAYAFKNLHPEQPLLHGRLPGLAPRLFLVRKGVAEGFEEIRLTLSTIWCFPHRERLVLVHHGRARLAEEDASDIARVVIGADRLGELRPAEAFRAVMTLRADTKDGALSALRDADLVPAAWLRPDPALALPDPETSPLAKIFARHRKNLETQYAAAVATVKAQGIDPGQFALPPLPPPRQTPTLEELPAFVAAARQEMEEAKATAAAALAAKKLEIAEQLAAAGMTEAEIQEKLNPKAKGPPAFSAETVRAEIKGQISARRVLGQLTLELEAQLASPEIAAQLDKAEAAARSAYRLTAHHQAPADAAPLARAQKIRDLMASDTAAARVLYDLHGADLSGLNLSGIDLSGVCLDGANLAGTIFIGAKLVNVVLAHARMAGCVLDGADLSGASLGKAYLAGASLRRTVLKKAVLAGADLTRASLAGADLEAADLSDAMLAGADFSQVRAPGLLAMKLSLRGLRAPGIILDKAKFLECDLTGADLSGASLERAVFLDCKLTGVRLAGARLRKSVFVKQCDLSHADLSGAELSEANLRETRLHGALLNGALLRQADFSGSDMTQARLANVRADDCRLVAAVLRDADLRRGCFAGADFARSDLRGADLTGASVYGANMPRVQLDENTRRSGMLMTAMRYLPVYEAPKEPRV